MKTVRFSQVVAGCGLPQVYLPFSTPGRDPALRALVMKSRVMTVHQYARGGRKDFGTVGLLKLARTEILIFPRSLKRFEERRIVGIDYTLLDKGSGGAGRSVTRRHRSRPRKESAPRRRKKADILAFVAEEKLPNAPVEPVSHEEIRADLRTLRRELMARKVSPARDRLTKLIKRIEAIPEAT